MTSIAVSTLKLIHQSLKRTAIVLADHEDALKGKLLTTQKEVESEKYTQVALINNYETAFFRWEQNESLSKYESVWERYRVQYNSTEKAQGMQATETQLNNFCQESESIDNPFIATYHLPLCRFNSGNEHQPNKRSYLCSKAKRYLYMHALYMYYLLILLYLVSIGERISLVAFVLKM